MVDIKPWKEAETCWINHFGQSRRWQKGPHSGDDFSSARAGASSIGVAVVWFSWAAKPPLPPTDHGWPTAILCPSLTNLQRINCSPGHISQGLPSGGLPVLLAATQVISLHCRGRMLATNRGTFPCDGLFGRLHNIAYNKQWNHTVILLMFSNSGLMSLGKP